MTAKTCARRSVYDMRHTSHHEATWGATTDAPLHPTVDRHRRVRSEQDQVLFPGFSSRGGPAATASPQIPDDHVGHARCTNSYTPRGIRNPLFAESVSFGPSEAESQGGGGDLAVAVKRDW